FDWKQSSQFAHGTANAGMSVKLVNADSPLTLRDFWHTQGSDKVTNLFHNDISYQDFTDYQFSLSFSPGAFTITISEGDTVLDSISIEDDTYTSGKFGLYDFSQPEILYQDLTRSLPKVGEYNYDVKAVDPDGDTLTYSLIKAPQGATIEPDTGKIIWFPSRVDLGEHRVTLQVEDGRGGRDQQTYIIEVVDIEPASIRGTVYNDLDHDGLFDGKEDNQPENTITPENEVNPIRLIQISTPFNSPIGIDYHEPTDSLVVSVNYFSGFPRNFERIAEDGNHIPFSNLSGFRDEVKIATVRSGNIGGFVAGDLFVGNGVDGEIVRITDNGNTVINPWVSLLGDNNGLIRGSLYLDRTGVFSGDLIVVTTGGQVWRIDRDGNTNLLANIGTHLEGLITVPNNLNRYGPLAGKIITGAETVGLLYAIDTSGNVTSYNVGVSIEDIDFIEPNENFFGVNFGTSKILGAPASEFNSIVGDILLTQEFHSGSGLYRLYWDGTALQTQQLTLTSNSAPVGQWEHITFAPAGVVEIPVVPTEPRLSEWVVYLDENGNNQRDKGERFTITDELGNYSFNNLIPGNYRVREELPLGWVQTAPSGGTHELNLRSGEQARNINFGNREDSATVNKIPEFKTSAPTEVNSGELFRYNAVAIDPNGDSLTYELLVKPVGMTVEESTGVIVWQPTETQNGFHDVIIRVNDGRGGVTLQQFQVIVTPANIQPIITSSPPKIAALNLPYEYQIRAQDGDGNIVDYNLDKAPEGVTIDSTGVIRWTPTQVGDNEIQITVTDNDGGKGSQSFVLQVVQTAVNQMPSFLSLPPTKARLGNLYQYHILAEDKDGDPLTYRVKSGPEGITISQTGVVTWTPTASQLGDKEVLLEIDDNRGGIVQQNYTINVGTQIRNNFPEITSTPNLNAIVGEEYAYNATSVDPEGDTILWSLEKAPLGVEIDPLLGTLRWNPTTQQIGNHEIELRAIDSQGAFASQIFTLTVRGTNLPPTILSTPGTMATLDTPYSYQAVGTDPEGDNLTWSVTAGPADLVIDAATGVISWTPQKLGNVDVTLEVADELGAIATQTYTIKATTARNQAPALTSIPSLFAYTDTAYIYKVTAEDPDEDDLRFQLLDGPVGMTIQESTGKVVWLEPILGQYWVVVGVNDGRLRASQLFDLTVLENLAPVITSSPETYVTLGQGYSYDVIS
ncbi:MAG: hypothetical protein GDA44_02545, partial [Prochloron sp. SP5CPC1]|nr:hypothetical protein [Candidatus Paraprochloron terpiosi SP5CPC1]